MHAPCPSLRRWLEARLFLPLVACSGLALILYSLWHTVVGPWNGPRLYLNLALAWAPYLFALAAAALSETRPGVPALLWPPGLLWLLFYPNAPYLITDWLYLPGWTAELWYGIAILSCFSACGVFLSLVSLHIMHCVVRTVAGTIAGWAVVIVAASIGGLGLYLGRFVRLNSWDVFSRPDTVLDDLLRHLNSEGHAGPLGFTVVFAALQIVSYYAFRAIRLGTRTQEEQTRQVKTPYRAASEQSTSRPSPAIAKLVDSPSSVPSHSPDRGLAAPFSSPLEFFGRPAVGQGHGSETATMDLTEFPATTTIFKAGDPSLHAFLIRQGTVELLCATASGLTPVAQLGPGEVFGEMSLIEERPRGLTARAVTAVKASGLTREKFEHVLTADPATFRIYLRSLFERLRALSAHVEPASVVAPSPPALATTSRLPVYLTIHPLSRRAAATLPGDGLAVSKFPFRIGRAAEEGENVPLDINDLWLIDRLPFNISRNHASIERDGDALIVKDRGSSLGVYINDTHIGGSSPLRQMPLEDGDNVVVLGGRMSPYQFRMELVRG
jgi:uncharacterized membrane protein/CRP-like cAMP-binding protein